MQCVLGIDFSCQPCEFTVSRIEGSQIEVLHRATVNLPLFMNREALRTRDITTVLRKGSDQHRGGSDEAGSPEDSANVDYVDGESFRQLLEETVTEIRQTLGTFETPWTASSVILPQYDHLSLNLELPFGDPRNLDRIVDLEVQDVVPFELEEFSVQYSSLGPAVGGSNAAPSATPAVNYDVHVGILPRQVVRNALEICKAAGLEPNIITVPSSALGAAYHIAKDFLKSNSAIVFNRGDEYSLAISINGEVRAERSVYASQIISALPPERKQDQLQPIFTALKLILTSAERRYNTRVDRVYLLGREVKAANTQQLLDRPLEGLSFKDLLKSDESPIGLSPLGSLYAADNATKAPLSNFRAREFSFAPRIGEFIRALFGTRRHAVATVLVVLVCLGVVFGAREYLIRAGQDALIQEIQRVIPNFSADPSKIRDGLAKAESALAAELGVFGSQAKVSPADAFLEVVKNLPDGGDVSINSIRVSGLRVQLTGNAGELSSIERFANTFKTRTDIFNKTDYKNTRTGSRFNFTIDITLTQ